MRKWIALLLAAGMLLGLAACSSGPENPADTADAAEKSAESAAEEPAPELYIPLIGRDVHHPYWQAVAQGAEQAAREYGAEVTFHGPSSELEVDEQAALLQAELSKGPDAVILAALSTGALEEALQVCAEEGIPVIGVDSGVPGDTSGAVRAAAAADDRAAAALAAEHIGEHAAVVAALRAAEPDHPVVIGCLTQDTITDAALRRTDGFLDRMREIAETYHPGAVAVTGPERWAAAAESPAVILAVVVPEFLDTVSLETAVKGLLDQKPAAVFCTAESMAGALLTATGGGTELDEGGTFAELVVAGFGAGADQKDAVGCGKFLGAVVPDAVEIGYQAVKLAVQAADGEVVSDAEVGARWYDAENLDDPEIAALVYD